MKVTLVRDPLARQGIIDAALVIEGVCSIIFLQNGTVVVQPTKGDQRVAYDFWFKAASDPALVIEQWDNP